ncbi:MAG: hypothetical protein V4773_00755 [Verrucomicrobiota bacterium]
MHPFVAEYLKVWVVGNIVGLISVTVMSFVGSFFALEGLAALDKWLRESDERSSKRGLKETPPDSRPAE